LAPESASRISLCYKINRVSDLCRTKEVTAKAFNDIWLKTVEKQQCQVSKMKGSTKRMQPVLINR